LILNVQLAGWRVLNSDIIHCHGEEHSFVEKTAENGHKYCNSMCHRICSLWMKQHCFTMFNLTEHWQLKEKCASKERGAKIG